MQDTQYNAKKYLLNIKKLDNIVKNKKLELEEIQSKMVDVQGISYEPKVSGSINVKSPQERFMYKFIEYQDELEKAIDKSIEFKREAMSLVDKIDNADCVDVLYMRYFQFKKWEEIAVEKNYSYQGICKLHGKALMLMNKILKSIQK